MTEGANNAASSRGQDASAASGVQKAAQGGQTNSVTVKRRSPYERITYDLESDHKVKQEVRLGKRVGFYKLRGQLGTGNFAKVKLGIHLLTTG
jgi:serine/threonine-protein kinase NIM1